MTPYQSDVYIPLMQLAITFPSLRQRTHLLNPWRPERLEAWAASVDADEQGRLAAQLILEYWDPDRNWSCGRFSLVEAHRYFDRAHKDALLGWLDEQWRFPARSRRE